jgi:predicted regulator of Ras-like GTPase activity (Roadblock/LC7/MglB family)
MANTDLSQLNGISGFIGACLVDTETGFSMKTEGTDVQSDITGAVATDLVRAHQEALSFTGSEDRLETAQYTLGSRYHVIHRIKTDPSVCLHVALDRKAANLGMALARLKRVGDAVSFAG